MKTLAVEFFKELSCFEYGLSGPDRQWNVIFPDDRTRWNYLHINQYQETFYVSLVNGDAVIAVGPGDKVEGTDSFGQPRGYIENEPLWEHVLIYAKKWLKRVKKEWIRSNRIVQEEYPLEYRCGIVPHTLVRESLKDFYRLDFELGKQRTAKLVKLIESGWFRKDTNLIRESMTADDYFEYCRIAYIAAERTEDTVDKTLAGRDMYKRFADGRHEGILDIDSSSPKEFADWIDHKHPKRGMGGHPWEIKRGGNTTHIDLYVMRPQYRDKGFIVELRGEHLCRMNETLRMLVAIHESGLPISIVDPDNVRKRLLAQDNIGIIPSYWNHHRANQHFDRKQCVYDTLHYNDLGRYKRRITPFITWEPLPVLKPRI